MKKFIIAVIAVFLLTGGTITVMLVGASRVSLYYRDSNDHLRDVIVNGSKVCASHTDSDAPDTILDPSNTASFMDAVTRSGLLHKVLPPGNKKGIVVTFADGAVYTVVDGGTDSSGKDVAYIIYEYQNQKYYYTLTGYRTYNRVSECVSPEGFGYKNQLAGD